MENVLLDRRSSVGSFEFSRRAAVGGGFRRPATPRGAYGASPTCQMQQYHDLHKGGAWWHGAAPALPYARPPLYSSPSLPLLPSNQPPLLPLPPTATKYATFPYPPPLPPPARAGRASAVVPAAPATAAAAAAPSRQRDRRRGPSRPPPPSSSETTKQQMKKKPLERATPLPPALAVTEALDDLEQEVARNFVQDLLHVLAPPPSSLPLPRFSLVVKPASPAASNKMVPSCNAEAAAADGPRRLLRL
ncbi:hypothetical protein GUJ93_ZPchr0006g41030 [Zizania palustris]|uniref:Uncharacterized protein n=1 Tax=Zizania palustris TaxID=103762 RepID=A0A8J5TAD4_ZIZPA|nr:hypothetical protein GUJ93_ZPchr0006g41030 [Zizania palustris]